MKFQPLLRSTLFLTAFFSFNASVSASGDQAEFLWKSSYVAKVSTAIFACSAKAPDKRGGLCYEKCRSDEKLVGLSCNKYKDKLLKSSRPLKPSALKMSCRPGEQLLGALCYPKPMCRPGYSDKAGVCWSAQSLPGYMPCGPAGLATNKVSCDMTIAMQSLAAGLDTLLVLEQFPEIYVGLLARAVELADSIKAAIPDLEPVVGNTEAISAGLREMGLIPEDALENIENASRASRDSRGSARTTEDLGGRNVPANVRDSLEAAVRPAENATKIIADLSESFLAGVKRCKGLSCGSVSTEMVKTGMHLVERVDPSGKVKGFVTSGSSFAESLGFIKTKELFAGQLSGYDQYAAEVNFVRGVSNIIGMIQIPVTAYHLITKTPPSTPETLMFEAAFNISAYAYPKAGK